MFYIENEQLKVNIEAKGAELQRIFSKETNLDYLWNGDPAFWGKHSPILFPIVGTLKNDRYYFEDKPYHMTRHGFARDMNFTVTAQTENSIELMLKDNIETLAMFPFHFELYVKYTLDKNKLSAQYRVVDTGSKEMYFSIGAHPAFKLPIEEGFLFEDYYLKFSEKETLGRWPISPQGLIEALPVAMLIDQDRIHITHELFKKDAVVFKYPESKQVKLISDITTHGLNFDFPDFPFLGIWSYKEAHFICIEPWCGIADSVASDQQLIAKEGINLITPGEEFRRQWSVDLF
jgi:galactose mutarotase-like enzyme